MRWNDGTIRRIAKGIYEERAFGRLPVLGDALLDAGCDSEEILRHCSESGAVHVRGCWGSREDTVMTESEWAACDEPVKMLAALRKSETTSERKLWLFVSHCARGAWRLPPGALEEMENLALEAPWSAAWGAVKLAGLVHGDGAPVCPGLGAYQARHLRELFGPLPFRRVAVQPAWKTADVTALARAIYEQGDFGRMPQLTHALLAAGCDEPDVLDHCLSSGGHVRGCWVIDILLGWE